MPYFKPKKIKGVVYDLSHLDSFDFELRVNKEYFKIKVIFSHHCFTEKRLKHHTPDFFYHHKGDNKRAFCMNRYTLSLALPKTIQTLGNATVYHSEQNNFFFVRTSTISNLNGPYIIFFKPIISRSSTVDVAMHINSAYLKPNMTQEGSGINFTTLIEATANNRKIYPGKKQRIKRK